MPVPTHCPRASRKSTYPGVLTSRELTGDGFSPPPLPVGGSTARLVVVSLTGRPEPLVSNPHVSARNCSSFWLARMVVDVWNRAACVA